MDNTELVYMRDHPDYLSDYSLSQGIVLKYEKLLDASMDDTKAIAESVKDSTAELDDHQISNQELQYEYDEKHEKLK